MISHHMTTHARAVALTKKVAALYRLSRASRKMALLAARRHPTRAIRCYSAILRSL